MPGTTQATFAVTTEEIQTPEAKENQNFRQNESCSSNKPLKSLTTPARVSIRMMSAVLGLSSNSTCFSKLLLALANGGLETGNHLSLIQDAGTKESMEIENAGGSLETGRCASTITRTIHIGNFSAISLVNTVKCKVNHTNWKLLVFRASKTKTNSNKKQGS
ncbi:MAG: hypothetical protein GOV15_00860 [Candidatus Diapherotrites archaeon]|nr:hypothetical protein [Candidatus Diapherotrites archaeon]